MSERTFTEREIRDAVWELNKKYRNFSSVMNFHDMVLIENVLMNFERILFVGEIRKETQRENEK